MGERTLPRPTPETQAFWDAIAEGTLLLQRCPRCAHVWFPPRPFCPTCSSREPEAFAASGHATLHSYVIHHRPVPGFEPPYVIAVVELAEGPRMMTNLVGLPADPAALPLDLPLRLVPTEIDGTTLPLFGPAEEQAS